MAEESIISLIGAGAIQQVTDAELAVDSLAAKVALLAANIASLDKSASGSSGGGAAKSTKDLTGASVQLEKIEKDLAISKEKLITLNTDLAQSQLTQTAALKENIKAIQDEAKANTDNAKSKVTKTKADSAAKTAIDAENKAIIDNHNAKIANEKSTKNAETAIRQTTAARQKEEAEIRKNNSAYAQLSIEYEKAASEAKELGTQLFNLKRSTTPSTQAIVDMGVQVSAANKKALELSKGLYQIEQATGNSKRNVGNYNGLMFETNQIMREMPNFALSARIGMMALSNNLPMFADQFSQASKAISDTTGKAVGFSGALKTMSKAIFGWQGLLILAITLLLQYGKQIGEFINQTTAAEKALEDYNKALKESNQSHSKEISNLLSLKGTLESVNSTRQEQINGINDFIRLYPGVLDGLTFEEKKTKLLTSAIQEQVDVMLLRARTDAAQKAREAAAQRVTDAITKQGEAISWWHLQWVEGYKGVDEAAARAIILSKNIEATTQATKDYHAATEALAKPLEETIKSQKAIYENTEKEIKQWKEVSPVDYGGSLIPGLEKRAKEIKDNIVKLEREKDAIYTGPANSSLKAAQIINQTKLDLVKKNSNDEIYLKRQAIELEKRVSIKALDDEYLVRYKATGKSYKNDVDYINARNLLFAKSIKAQRELTESLVDKNNPNNPKNPKAPYDPSKAKDDAATKLLEAQRKYDEQEIQAQIDTQKTLADDQSAYLQHRLDANARMEVLQLKQLDMNEGKEIEKKQISLDRIAEIEKIPEKKRTNQQKDMLFYKAAFEKEKEALQQTYATKKLAITQKNIDEENGIIISSLKYQSDLIKHANDAAIAQIDIEKNKKLEKLNEEYGKSNMSLRSYQKKRKTIMVDADKEVYELQKTAYVKLRKKLETSLSNSGLAAAAREQIEQLIKLIDKLMGKLNAPTGDKQPRIDWLAAFGLNDKSAEQLISEINRSLENILDQTVGMFGDAIEKQRLERFNKMTAQLNNEKDAIQDRYDAEKAAMMSTVQTQEERDKAIKQLDADKSAREKANDLAKKQNDKAKAMQEQKNVIFRIELQAALGAAKALSNVDQYPLNLFAAAAILVEGAVLAMRARNQQVPEYEKGTDNHPGGLAMVGHGTELVNLPSGQSFITPDNPILMNLPKGTEVIPNKALLDNANASVMKQASSMQTFNQDDYARLLVANFEQGLDRLGKKLDRAIANMPHDTIILKNGELMKLRETQNATMKYVNKIKGN